jgi:DNA-binding MarR family transcriptional regulator
MKHSDPALRESVDAVLETLPQVWDCIRSNLRAAATKGFGITLEQFHVLRHIKRGFSSVAELAEAKQVSRSAVSQAVDALVDKGLVTREEESGDRRCVRLGLTELARSAMEANYEANRLWMRDTMASLTREELKLLAQAMGILKTTFLGGEGRQ